MNHEISSLIRSALFVSDLKRSTAFYAALGLTEVYFEGELDAASTSAALKTPSDAVCRCRIVKPPGRPNTGMVGLFQLDPPLSAIPSPEGPPRMGEVALVFYAQPIAEVVDAARAAGATWSPDPTLFVMPHRQQLEVCLRDPDGVLINLIDRPPAEQDRTAPVGG
ncbi:VOC family protein [Phenylobacterium sp.]|uniref:VOC family protein n=1 Tax=Phenylobacterium sp. TaxID=1871053 RepID=UPI0037C96E60